MNHPAKQNTKAIAAAAMGAKNPTTAPLIEIARSSLIYLQTFQFDKSEDLKYPTKQFHSHMEFTNDPLFRLRLTHEGNTCP